MPFPSLPALPWAGIFRFRFSSSGFPGRGGDGGGLFLLFLFSGGVPGRPSRAWLERFPVPPLLFRDAAHPAPQPQRPPRRGAHRERGEAGSGRRSSSGRAERSPRGSLWATGLFWRLCYPFRLPTRPSGLPLSSLCVPRLPSSRCGLVARRVPGSVICYYSFWCCSLGFCTHRSFCFIYFSFLSGNHGNTV